MCFYVDGKTTLLTLCVMEQSVTIIEVTHVGQDNPRTCMGQPFNESVFRKTDNLNKLH